MKLKDLEKTKTVNRPFVLSCRITQKQKDFLDKHEISTSKLITATINKLMRNNK